MFAIITKHGYIDRYRYRYRYRFIVRVVLANAKVLIPNKG